MTILSGFKSFFDGCFRTAFFLGALAVAAGMGAGPAGAQALNVRTLDGGTEVLLVTQTLAEVSAACWPVSDDDGSWTARCLLGSELTFTAALEAGLGEAVSAPAVLVMVGGSGRLDAVDRAAGVLRGKTLDSRPLHPGSTVNEGGQERRLGDPGASSVLQLLVQLPPPQDPDRSAIEVLWNLLPRSIGDQDGRLRARAETDLGVLELSSEDDLGDLELRDLRLALAQVSGSHALEASDVVREAHRLRIARTARLERVESAGKHLLDLWVRGGSDAVRQYLFGPDGVTVDRVRLAAERWLPQHPGHAVFTLPPRHFRPRFAPGPRVTAMENDLSAAVLPRPSAPLSALVVRPVLLTDLTGQPESMLLARLAAALRRQVDRPAYIAVEQDPPRLELAADAQAFPSLCEALQTALLDVTGDPTPMRSAADARTNALRLMARNFGMNASSETDPRTVLEPGNLALGGVAPDAELALEAMEKFGVGGAPSPGTGTAAILESPRSRMPASGEESVVAVALPIQSGFPVPQTVAKIVSERVAALDDGTTAEMLFPLIPGHQLMVLVVRRETDLDQLEGHLKTLWTDLFRPADETELEPVRKRVAAEVVQRAGGVLGRARVCAAIAAGADGWRSPAEREMAALTVDLVAVNFDLQRLAELVDPIRTGSGPTAVRLQED